uniref:DUF834 domain-containing protein n=1 Tax=Oryza sativa subsp. japonica TaxID=39947 RepID=Q5Z4C6_ORYSJ|nr:hypothetical protein [Oryza sativa Japonica Group]BAD62406.1 hypothetical protein [Oryza sativa Japonica Group]
MNGRRRRRGKGGGVLRLDDDGDAPSVYSGGERADEDGDATVTTMVTFPSDGDGWSDGEARLERRRRRRLEGQEGGGEGPRRPAMRRKGKTRPNLERDGGTARLGFGRRWLEVDDGSDRWDPPVSD